MVGVQEMAARIGSEAQYAPGTGLTFPVTVTDARKAFGRTDYRITPLGGSGAVWVAGDRLTFAAVVQAA